MTQEQSQHRGCSGLLVFLFRAVDVFSRVVFAFFVLFFAFLFLAMLASAGKDVPTVPEEAALVIAPEGSLVEELSGDPFERFLDDVTDQAVPETLVADVVDALAAAEDDERIQAVYLDFDAMTFGGLDKLERVAQAIAEFKESGKPVIAGGDMFTKYGYYLAAHADEIYLHEMGAVIVDGYGLYRQYHRDLIERLGIDWNVFRPEVNVYKSAVEPFLRNDMSERAEEATLAFLEDLWENYREAVSQARGLDPEEMDSRIARLPELVQEAGGDLGKLSLDAGLVDHLGHRDKVRDRLVDVVGRDEEHHSFRQVSMDDYLKVLGKDRHRHPQKGEGVGVVYAVGTILDGVHPPGTIGGDSTAALIRKARYDDDVKAIVLRVDSGGGSAFASEVIRRELVLARDGGKPVVVSMGTLAASGGYWISTASDRILASPSTITGSIGIFGMVPTFEDPLAEYLGTHVDGVGTTWLAGSVRLDRELDPRVGQIIQSTIDQGYDEFLARVSEARDMPVDEVNEIARGRVWSGEAALERGLVDEFGQLDEAVAVAAELAELEEGYAVRRVERDLDPFDQFLLDMLEQGARVVGPEITASVARKLAGGGLLGSGDPRHEGLDRKLFRTVEDQVRFLGQFNDPNHAYASCFCEVR